MKQGAINSGKQETASRFSAPSISLPTGGGAIRGIDEKFSANPVTGTGSLSIPLSLSPGRSGFGPSLSLYYDSGSGNGIFGMGWSLALPSVLRRTDKGLPQYHDCAESDTFVLTGAEDLVRVLTQSPADAAHVEEYDRAGFRVTRYRPRIEGLFARIERWTHLGTGDTHWRSISPANILTVYGLDPNSRIADPEDSTRVFTWLICATYDDRGNAVVYEYAAENHVGVDLSKPGEAARRVTANRHLKRVRYGNRRPILLDPESPSFRRPHLEASHLDAAEWMFEVVFDYGENHYREQSREDTRHTLADASVHGVTPWALRKDPFSTFRSGFEIRTYRLCRRVLMFHHFAQELGPEPCLVRSTAFAYREKPAGSLLEQVTQYGHRRRHEGLYLTRALPPADFSYTHSPLENLDLDNFTVQEVDPRSLENLPGGVSGEAYRWIDLDGEGIAGVLSEQDSAWYYQPNLGEGRLGHAETVSPRPSLAALNRGQQLMDVSGHGTLALVELSPPAPGFYGRTSDAGWKGFRPFHSLPVRDWKDANLRFVDLTGDGIADVLITEDDAFTWHPSLLEDGFGAGIRVAVPIDERQGPHVVFADGTQSIFLADMSGDGLSDIVRIREGEVCYWPNKGYGRFGARVTMDDSPWFDEPDQFDPKRIRLADTDGSGTADIVYLARDGVKIYLNGSGNGWSTVRHLPSFPAVDDLASITVADFLGRGTACLVWSSPLPAYAERQLMYVDLMCGRKPHLLVNSANNLGAETRIQYASSTQFYLEDKAAGKPWITRLPFPVHVVERVETYDHISRNRFVTRYSYHHGYYDGVEREFRGFARVDQTDTEEYAALRQSSDFPVGDNIAAESSVPPVLTRTWFHTGAYLEGCRISSHLAHEYYREGSTSRGEATLSEREVRAMLLDDTVLPEHLTAEQAREACRALKGSMLRQEIYALDDKPESPRPYSVTESNLTLRMLQARGPNRYAVFFSHAREQVSFQYERKLYEVGGRLRPDPRVSHAVTLDVDDYGNVLQSVTITYGRRFPDPSPLLTGEDREKQSRILATLTEANYTNAVREPDAYRIPLICDKNTYELVNLTPDSAVAEVTNFFRFEELAQKITSASDGFHDLSFQDWAATEATGYTPYRRLLSRNRSLYRSNRLRHLLPPGALDSLALPGQNLALAFTSGLLLEIYRRGSSLEDLLPEPGSVLRQEGAYVDIDGSWWTSSGAIFYAREHSGAEEELAFALQHFFLPHVFRDPFGNFTVVAYDTHDLSPRKTIDAVGNSSSAEMDYRVLAPRTLTNMNGNRSEVAFDALGLVAGMAVMGKIGEGVGDTLDGFEPDLSVHQLEDFFAHPHRQAAGLLRGATVRSVYDVDRYLTLEKAAFVAKISRETHLSDLQPGESSRLQIGLSFSDGFGREIQKKMQADSGPLSPEGPVIHPRWIGSGWKIFNNKGKPVRQYEPFFSSSHDFDFATAIGVSPILFYDPAERVVATLNPNHTFEKVVFDPWQQSHWDANDTVTFDPKTDLDTGHFFLRLDDGDYLPTWFQQRIDGGAAEKLAAEKSAQHADTPATAYLDTLGRTFLSVSDNGRDAAGWEQKYPTRTVLDIQGNHRAVIDALGRTVVRNQFDMLGRQMLQSSMDAGERWTLSDVTGKSIRSWNSRLYAFRTEFDPLRRPTRSFVQGGDPYERNANIFPCEILFQKIVYGDSAECGFAEHRQREANLRGKAYRHFDSAGVVLTDRYDFKGNLLQTSQRFAKDYKKVPDWTQSPALEGEKFASSTKYDALNRVVITTAPDGSIYRPGYNESNLLRKVEIALTSSVRDGTSVWTPFVHTIKYNARGQRLHIEYANTAFTSYHYDAETFRLVRLRTTRDSNQSASGIFADASLVQDLSYTYDPVGNIVQIGDASLRTVFHDNAKVSSVSRYSYDPLYRLTEASGRENSAQSALDFAPSDGDYRDYPFTGVHASDPHRLRNYREFYAYDPVGNIQHMLHRANQNEWTREYSYDDASYLEADKISNRLSYTHLASEGQPRSESYLYDRHGSVVQMPHLPVMQWDFMDRLSVSARQVVNCGTAETTFYVYDSAGQRLRKVTESGNGTRKNERLYIGAFEVFRKFAADGVAIALERESLHLMDDRQRIALAETLTIDSESPFRVKDPSLRYQFANHLGSATLELDDTGCLISYEEYSPYGNTVYQASHGVCEVSRKRYRYTGKERDEETGFGYFGARYYAPWLARWTACDPAGLVDGPNVYAFSSGDPVGTVDQNGKETNEELDAGAPSAPPDQGDAGATKQNPDETLTVPADEAGTSLPGGAAPQAEAEQGQVVKEYVPRQGELAREAVKENIASAAHTADEFRQGVGAGVVNTPIGVVQSATETSVKTAELAEANPLLTATLGIAILSTLSLLHEGNSDAYNLAHETFEGLKADFPHTAAGETGNFFGGELATLPLALLGGGSGAGSSALAEDAALASRASRASRSVPFDPAKLARIERNLKDQVTFVYDESRLSPGSAANYLPETREIILRPEPTRAEVIEELLHFGQHRATGFEAGWGTTGGQIRNIEMAAQVKLANIKTLKWTQGEFQDWLAAWNWWRTRKI